jgi:hypothetical protein
LRPTSGWDSYRGTAMAAPDLDLIKQAQQAALLPTDRPIG